MSPVAISISLSVGVEPIDLARVLADKPGFFWLDEGFGGKGLMGCSDGPALQAGTDWPSRAREMLIGGPPILWRDRPIFAGGLVGWLGYEAGRFFESMPDPVAPPPLPDLWFLRHEGAFHYTGEPDAPWVVAGSPAFVAWGMALLEGVGKGRAPGPPTGGVGEREAPDRFLAGVSRVLEHIGRGDCYQVNLARRLLLHGVDDALSAFLRLRDRTPAAYGALVTSPRGSVVSNSPELYLHLQDRAVRSRPIKGTRPLGVDEVHTRALADELRDDPKERAELTMIVDLVRNDLGRVCRAGSVEAGPRTIARLPTLLHAHQEVRGELSGGRDVFDLIAASFPPGSVTGAPKVEAMRVIRALEAHPRGVYTGAIGWISDAGDACLNVAIRTATFGPTAGEATCHFGSGIVADSVPALELEETELKARALLGALCS